MDTKNFGLNENTSSAASSEKSRNSIPSFNMKQRGKYFEIDSTLSIICSSLIKRRSSTHSGILTTKTASILMMKRQNVKKKFKRIIPNIENIDLIVFVSKLNEEQKGWSSIFHKRKVYFPNMVMKYCVFGKA